MAAPDNKNIIMKAIMMTLHWTGSTTWHRVKSKIKEEWFVFRLTAYSLFYNSLCSWTMMADTAMEPMFWFVDHFLRYLGPIFIVTVVVLVTSVVVIFYICLLPEKLAESYFWTVYHLIVGHWLLTNIVFHYFKASFTSPGYPPENIPEVAAICKKCISPKPPRSHHCSVCNRCILKMDHHCPWLNNCVGHYNHRYFFLFCAYMMVGCVYVSISAYPLFKQHFYGNKDVGWLGIFYPLYLAKVNFFPDSDSEQDKVLSASHHNVTTGLWFHSLILFEFLLCSTATVAILGLLLWHIRLISRAETSIEVHTNKSEAERQHKNGLKYHNPYNFGFVQNWRLFLGITHGRSFWRHVLLPSSHLPDGDGLKWTTIYNKQFPINNLQLL